MNRGIGAVVRAYLEQGQSIAEMAFWLLKATEEEDPSAPPGNHALNEDGRLMIIARSLQKETYGGFESPWSSQFTNEKLQGLLHLEAVINETLRLKSSVPSGHPRVTPPEKLQLDEVWILGETIGVLPHATRAISPPARISYLSGGSTSELGNYILCFTETCIDMLNDAPGRYGCVGQQLALIQLRGAIS
ncbi:hypothetical protein N7494_010463 [Penicillium frequentans]|uniref:Uncharacterized protein n=1 Tax=Penicillium frequentans TaxID=3151616 RepID=A0AAD6CHV5_9EURO|nr:hypothetical protein N7494_010463 [Penicillium glabrum]